MSKSIQVSANVALLSRIRNGLRNLGRDRQGAELVEILVVIAIFALGGIGIMGTLRDKVGVAAGGVGDSVIGMTGYVPPAQ